jgi:hypothetical protein
MSPDLAERRLRQRDEHWLLTESTALGSGALLESSGTSQPRQPVAVWPLPSRQMREESAATEKERAASPPMKMKMTTTRNQKLRS